LSRGGYKHSTAIHADSNQWLRDEIKKFIAEDYTIFLYLDPYGLGVPFDTLMPLLERHSSYSTEILINLCTPILHRLAGRESSEQDEQSVEQRHAKLTSILGGDYWKDALLSSGNISAKEREKQLVNGYMSRLSQSGYLKYTGYCPVQESRSSQTKYYMIFASRHPDALELMNDQMLQAFEKYMHRVDTAETLFAGLDWTAWRDQSFTKRIALEYIGKYEGQTRKEIWVRIIQDHFMRFTASEYKQATKELLAEGRITSPTDRRSKKQLNDDCHLFLV
jgi:hypothetical protein